LNARELKAKLRHCESTVGAWVTLDHPAAAVLMARAGFDWIVIDLEHGHFTLGALRSCLDAIRHLDIATLVRVPSGDRTTCAQILDLGAHGLVVPMITGSADAEAVVRSCYYPPTGRRGLGAGRATDYGLDATDYFDRANSDVIIVVQIEQPEAVEEIGTIVAVDGIDAIFIGPADLSASLGHHGDIGHPDVQVAIQRVRTACASAGRAVGMWCVDSKAAASAAADGMSMVVWTSDAALLGGAARSAFDQYGAGASQTKMRGSE